MKSFYARFFTSSRRKQDDGHRLSLAVCFKGSQDSKSIHPGHDDIPENQIGVQLSRRSNHLFSIGDGVNAIALAEQTTQVVPHIGVVIRQDDQLTSGIEFGRLGGCGRELK
jgi:hypothetical protein